MTTSYIRHDAASRDFCARRERRPNDTFARMNAVAPIVSWIVRAPVESSAVNAIGYGKRWHPLEIEFHDGLIYLYQEVPQPLYLALPAAESKARYYNQHVRGKFHCLRVRPRLPHE